MRLLADDETSVLAAGAALLAGASRLFAAAEFGLDGLREAAARLSELVAAPFEPRGGPGKLSLAGLGVAVSATRHFGISAAERDASSPTAEVARLAAAVIARANDRQCDLLEPADRAVAALLQAAGAQIGGGKPDVERAATKLAGLVDGQKGKPIADYVKKRLSILVQILAIPASSAWDL